MDNENKKIYEFRKLLGVDIFPMVKLLSKVGLNKFTSAFKSEEVQKLVADIQENGKDNINMLVGGTVALEIAQIILESIDKCEDDILNLLERTSNLSLEQIKQLDLITFTDMIIDFVKKDEFMDFIRAASKFVK